MTLYDLAMQMLYFCRKTNIDKVWAFSQKYPSSCRKRNTGHPRPRWEKPRVTLQRYYFGVQFHMLPGLVNSQAVQLGGIPFKHHKS